MTLDPDDTKPPGLWSLAVSGYAENPEDADQALARLCRDYWLPAYAFFRGEKIEPDDARRLTEDLIRTILSRETIDEQNPSCIRLRQFFFLTAKHKLASFHTDPSAPASETPELPFSPDYHEAEHRFLIHGSDFITNERLYDRLWALLTFDITNANLRSEFTRREGDGHFEVFARFLPRQLVNRLAYKHAAKEVRMSEEDFLRKVDDLRARFRSLLNHTVADTLLDRALISNEVHSLYWSLRR